MFDDMFILKENKRKNVEILSAKIRHKIRNNI